MNNAVWDQFFKNKCPLKHYNFIKKLEYFKHYKYSSQESTTD